MGVCWSQLLVKATVWLTMEVYLSLLGLDNLADYSEFLFHDRSRPVLVAKV